MAFGALDQVPAGTLPFYQMRFHLIGYGDPVGDTTFVPGGNAKISLQINVPTPFLRRRRNGP